MHKDNKQEEIFMGFEQIYERFVLGAIIAFLLILAICAGLGTHQARSVLAGYSFFMMGVYLFRGWYFKQPYSYIEIAGCGLIGVVLEALNYLMPPSILI